jgi:hemerythrin-like domain-containing protein
LSLEGREGRRGAMGSKEKTIAVWTVVFLFAAAAVWSQELRGPMKPVGPLMMEHRLIERMTALMVLETTRMKDGKPADPIFVGTVVDFFRIYGDKTHHGKEEDILFLELSKKNLTPEHRKIMADLIAEHEQARLHVKRLAEAADRLGKDDAEADREVRDALSALAVLYPRHIFQEDRRFFLPALDYLSDEEEAQMVRRMIDYDRNMIHMKYREVVAESKERMQK